MRDSLDTGKYPSFGGLVIASPRCFANNGSLKDLWNPCRLQLRRTRTNFPSKSCRAQSFSSCLVMQTRRQAAWTVWKERGTGDNAGPDSLGTRPPPTFVGAFFNSHIDYSLTETGHAVEQLPGFYG
jgi:hypothetical protein